VNLLATELRRFAARRAMRWLVVFALAVIALAMVILAANIDDPANTGQTRCPVTVTDSNGNVTIIEGECPQQEADPFVLHDELSDIIGGTGIALLLLSILLGTTFIGAEYIGNSLGGQLAFEPRRTYVYAIKALAVAIWTALITAFLLVVVCAAIFAVAQWRAEVGDLDGEWFTQRLGDIARVSLVAGAAGILGYAVTTIARRSVVAVVAFLALLFIVEPALTSALDLFDGRTPVFPLIMASANDFTGDNLGIDSLAEAVAVAGTWITAIVLLGGFVFARREIR
jgi:hypothetical protein